MGANDLVDLIGSNETRSQFPGGKIPCREPDILAWLIDRGWNIVMVDLFLKLLGGMQKGRTDLSPHTSEMMQVDPGRRHCCLLFL